MSDRRALVGLAAPLVLVVALAAAIALPIRDGLELRTADPTAASTLSATLDRLPDDGTVLVGFDPDLGTYAEIRSTVRVLLGDLLERESTLAILSVTPEGRALAIAELAHLERLDANPDQIVDLGFLPGAEAALVAVARALGPDAASADAVDLPTVDRLGGADLALVVGGNDLGPRSWVEQVAPRVPALELVAVAPTVLLPQLLPYRDSGQLAALLATPGDGAAYRASVQLGSLSGLADAADPPGPAVFVGVVAAIAVLGQSMGTRAVRRLRAIRARDPR